MGIRRIGKPKLVNENNPVEVLKYVKSRLLLLMRSVEMVEKRDTNGDKHMLQAVLELLSLVYNVLSVIVEHVELFGFKADVKKYLLDIKEDVSAICNMLEEIRAKSPKEYCRVVMAWLGE
jgi:hypothetical protein